MSFFIEYSSQGLLINHCFWKERLSSLVLYDNNIGCAGGSVNIWLVSTRNNNDVGEADKRWVDVEERSDGDTGSSGDARVSIDVVERTDGDAGSSAGARVSINVGERTDGDAESAASASEDAFSSVMWLKGSTVHQIFFVFLLQMRKKM